MEADEFRARACGIFARRIIELTLEHPRAINSVAAELNELVYAIQVWGSGASTETYERVLRELEERAAEKTP